MSYHPTSWRNWRWVPTVDCENCSETFPQEDGPVCPYCGYDHSEEKEKESV